MNIPDDKKVRDFTRLLELAKAMSVEKDLYALLDLIVQRTTEVMEADRTSLYLVDADKQQLWTRIAQGLEIKEVRVPIGTGISGHVAKTRETVNIQDAYLDPRFDRAWDVKTGYRTRSILCMPLLTHEDRVVGVIQVLNKEGGVFTSYDESLLAALGSHAAIALDQARLMQHYVEKQRMQEALRIARDIQMSLLPKKAPSVPGFDIAGWTQPCDETGGDYYDFIPLPDGRLGIAIGDVSSHGVGPALLMTASRALLRAFVNMTDDISQALLRMNNMLASDMEGGRFVTLFYGVLDPKASVVTYSSAGQDPPLLFEDGTKTFRELGSTGMPIGVMPDTDFPVGDPVTLTPGDVLLMATDGVIEAMDAQNEKFERERLRRVIQAHHTETAAQLIQTLYREVRAFCAEAPQRDDITIIVVKALPR